MTELNYTLSVYEPTQQADTIALFAQTFADSEGAESSKVIERLVSDLLTTTPTSELKGFVAQQGEKLIGAIFFTPMPFDDGETPYLLSPVATLTTYQGKGVAQALINFGLAQLKQQGITVTFTYGDPNFYGKVGFEQVTEAQFKAPHTLSQPHGWLAQSLTEQPLTAISGSSSCAKGLDNPAYW